MCISVFGTIVWIFIYYRVYNSNLEEFAKLNIASKRDSNELTTTEG